MSTHYPALFTPVQLGDIRLGNRLVMAPMTRARCPQRVATDSVVIYYAQRAGAGLIITEAVSIARPYISTPDCAGRVAGGVALNQEADPIGWYGGGDEGYIDSPVKVGRH